MGLGHFGGGAAAARWLARQGAIVTVTDLADATTLAEPLSTLAGVPIAQYHLGGHQEEDFRSADLVVVNPAVRQGNRFIQLAVQAGALLTSEVELFAARCPAPIIGVTGSNGKSTTAAMIAAILEADGRHVWLGGNIGVSLLDRLEEIRPEHWIVLELSSFQLRHLGSKARLPEVAVLTNCTPNHLDWHGSFEDYAAAKQRILTGQQFDALAVLNPFDPEVSRWRRLVRGTLVPCVDQGVIPALRLPGEHNRQNALCAATAAVAVGCSSESIRTALERFGGLPHRLEMFAVFQGRRFYNDSAATTPEATIAALESLQGRTWLLAGGSDKGSGFGPLADAITRLTTGAAFFGTVRENLLALVLSRARGFTSNAVQTLDEALAWCWQRSRPGENIMLSPACASHDQFRNYRHRGEFFVDCVRKLAKAASG